MGKSTATRSARCTATDSMKDKTRGTVLHVACHTGRVLIPLRRNLQHFRCSSKACHPKGWHSPIRARRAHGLRRQGHAARTAFHCNLHVAMRLPPSVNRSMPWQSRVNRGESMRPARTAHRLQGMRHALLLLVNDKLAERIMKRILDLHARRAFSRAIAATALTV